MPQSLSNNHIPDAGIMVNTAAYERIEHAKTAAVLRRILTESGSYLQTSTREAAVQRVACTGNCVCLPNTGISGSDPPNNVGAAK